MASNCVIQVSAGPHSRCSNRTDPDTLLRRDGQLIVTKHDGSAVAANDDIDVACDKRLGGLLKFHRRAA